MQTGVRSSINVAALSQQALEGLAEGGQRQGGAAEPDEKEIGELKEILD